MFMLVDDEDYELMSRFAWRLKPDKDTFYAQVTVSAHKLLVNYSLVDHANGNGLDNRRDNLRTATPRQSSQNRGLRSDSLTGYKGVSFRPERYRANYPYIARIQVDGKRRTLGRYSNPVEAAKAYDAAAREHFGEFACVNFPDEGGDAEK